MLYRTSDAQNFSRKHRLSEFFQQVQKNISLLFRLVRLILVANQNFGTKKTTMASKLPPPPIVNPKRKNFLGQPAPQGYVAGVGRG